jgi:nucleoside-diphosphate-sugar epimerase
VASKIEAERRVRSGGRPAVILRPHIVYGPGDTKLLPRLLAARRRGRLVVPGDGRALVSLTHVDNLCHAVSLALVAPVHGVEILNVADEAVACVDEVLRTLLEALDLPTRLVYLPVRAARPLARVMEWTWAAGRMRSAPPLTRYLVDQLAGDHTLSVERARSRLGYAPRRDFREAFAELA